MLAVDNVSTVSQHIITFLNSSNGFTGSKCSYRWSQIICLAFKTERRTAGTLCFLSSLRTQHNKKTFCLTSFSKWDNSHLFVLWTSTTKHNTPSGEQLQNTTLFVYLFTRDGRSETEVVSHINRTKSAFTDLSDPKPLRSSSVENSNHYVCVKRVLILKCAPEEKRKKTKGIWKVVLRQNIEDTMCGPWRSSD